MRWSTLFIPTLRDDPAGAATASHRLLLRAGYVREPAAGEFHYLLLARLSLRRIVAAVRGALDAAGAQEVLLAGGGDFAHGVAGAAHGELRSYKQLPQTWYQFDTRTREEARPGLGILGGRKQFTAELCSIALGDCRIEEALRRALEMCGVAVFAVEAPGSKRLLIALSEAGEQRVAMTGYNQFAHWELVRAEARPPDEPDPAGDLEPEAFHTPDRKTIAEVAAFTGLPETSQMKSVVVAADGAVALALVRGDHAVSEAKLARALGAEELRPAMEAEIQKAFGAGAGSLGPVGLQGVRILADHALDGRRNMICGANRDDYHLRHVTPGEDFEAEFCDLRQVTTADGLPMLGAIELAAIEQQGPAPEALRVLDPNGKEIAPRVQRAVLYLERILCAAAELNHDGVGLALPWLIAPFDVVVTAVNYKDAAMREAADGLYGQCRVRSLAALLDDRDERPGVKFKDADLIGVPYRITVGKRIGEGLVEVTDRRSRSTIEVPVAEATAEVRRRIHGD